MDNLGPMGKVKVLSDRRRKPPITRLPPPGCVTVVNEDGSLSRIANWSSMTEKEQDLARRRITKRNQERLERLRPQAVAADSKLVSALQPPSAI